MSIFPQYREFCALEIQFVLSRYFLLTSYKAFVRPRLDYLDVIYDKIFHES